MVGPSLVAAVLPHIHRAVWVAQEHNGGYAPDPTGLARDVVDTARAAGWSGTDILGSPCLAVSKALEIWGYNAEISEMMGY